MLAGLQNAVSAADEFVLGVAGDFAEAAVHVADDAGGIGECDDGVVVQTGAHPGEEHGLVAIEGVVERHGGSGHERYGFKEGGNRDAGRAQPLTAPAAIPSTRRRWRSR